MKTLIAVISLFPGWTSPQAQSDPVNSGKVVYDEVVKLEIKLEGDASQFAHMLPKERKSVKVLYYNQEEWLYEKGTAEEESIDDVVESGNTTVQIKMMEPDNKLYTDFENQSRIEQREFMSRVFLVRGEMPDHSWKMTGRQKMILGYPCQEATMDKDEQSVSAWFTPAIPVPAGPGHYGNLPGLVLALDVNEGERVITARSVESMELSADQLKKPRKGKKVSAEEYEAIVAEKMEEMGNDPGAAPGGHQMMIRVER